MKQEAKKTAAPDKKRSVWVPVIIVSAAAVVLLVLLIVGARLLSSGSSVSAPVLEAEGSAYRMYELRNRDVLLTYSVRLRNETDKDMEGFTLRAVLPQDRKIGFLFDENGTVRLQSGEETLSLPAGVTRSFDIVITASYNRINGSDAPSGELPQLYAVYPDGSEGKIEIK